MRMNLTFKLGKPGAWATDSASAPFSTNNRQTWHRTMRVENLGIGMYRVWGSRTLKSWLLLRSTLHGIEDLKCEHLTAGAACNVQLFGLFSKLGAHSGNRLYCGT